MPESQPQISPGAESLIRASLAKGFYYGDEKCLLNTAESLISFSKEKDIAEKINAYREKTAKLAELEERQRMSRVGEIYLELWKQEEIANEITKLRAAANSLRTEILNFVIKTMESIGIMEREYTYLVLKKLPLTLRGTRGVEEEGEETEEEEELRDEEF